MLFVPLVGKSQVFIVSSAHCHVTCVMFRMAHVMFYLSCVKYFMFICQVSAELSEKLSIINKTWSLAQSALIYLLDAFFFIHGCFIHLQIVHQTVGPAWMNHLW